MRCYIVAASCIVTIACGPAGTAFAQTLPGGMSMPGLANLKMVQPEPERAGDRGLSCAQITSEMGTIMQRRNVTGAAASSKRKICSSKKTLDRQVAEKQKLQQAQTPSLIAAGVAPGPAATAIHAKANAETMALEQSQQADRKRATADLTSGAVDMMGAFNDGRLMRLGMLAQERHCAENAPPPTKPAADACEEEGAAPHIQPQERAAPRAMSLPGNTYGTAADPFVHKGKPSSATPAPSESDPFSRR